MLHRLIPSLFNEYPIDPCCAKICSVCLFLHLPEVNRKTRNENSQTNTGEYWIWPGSNAITHFNDSQKMNIATAKVIKLKLHVSVPGWPEKTCPKKPRREKRAGNLGRARHILRPPPGLYILNKLLKITKPAKAKI